MWAIQNPEDHERILAGFVECDFLRRVIRPRMDLVEAFAAALLFPEHLGDRMWLIGMNHLLETHPIPGRPGEFWVVSALTRTPLEIYRRTGFLLRIARVSLRSVEPLPDPPVWRLEESPTGLFVHRLSAVSPTGELVIPGWRITPDLQAIPDPRIGAGFQGFLPDGQILSLFRIDPAGGDSSGSRGDLLPTRVSGSGRPRRESDLARLGAR